MGPSFPPLSRKCPLTTRSNGCSHLLKASATLVQGTCPKLFNHDPLLWCFKLELFPGWGPGELWPRKLAVTKWCPCGKSSLSGLKSLIPVMLDAHVDSCIAHCLVRKPNSSLLKLVWSGFSRLQPESPSDFAASHNQYNRKRNQSYLGSFGEEKSNFRIIVVAGRLQRSLACLRKGTGRTSEYWPPTLHTYSPAG